MTRNLRFRHLNNTILIDEEKEREREGGGQRQRDTHIEQKTDRGRQTQIT